MAVSPLLFLSLVLAQQEAPELDKQVDQLVEKLKDLGPDASRTQFLGRPALSKLMALGSKAFPRLKHHFLEQQDWRLKASVGYLAILLDRRDPEIRVRWKTLCEDPDVFVRMLMVSLSREFAGGSCGTAPLPVMTALEASVYDRVGLDTSLEWMSTTDLVSLAAQALAILKEGKPLVDPPVRDNLGTYVLDNDPKRLRSSGVRLLTPKARMAELSLIRALQVPGTHEVVMLIMEAAEADDGSDPPRLGRLFSMAGEAAWHGNGCRRRDGTRDDCPKSPENKRRLFALCEKWAWKVTDPNAQYGLLNALDGAGLWKAYDLRERLSKDHPDEQVRELAGHNLIRVWNSMYDRRYTREQEAEVDLKLEEARKRP